MGGLCEERGYLQRRMSEMKTVQRGCGLCKEKGRVPSICSLLLPELRAVKILVSWCFKPSQSQSIISGLRETFIYIYTHLKGPIRQNRVRKQRVVGRIYGMKYS